MSFQGIDRRRNRVYVTRNTEYHLRDDVCVAVRDRQSGAFRDAHIAVRLKLEGRIRTSAKGGAAPGPLPAQVGDALFFMDVLPDGRHRQITTSRVQQIERPDRRDLSRYGC
jgi:hypothetical protein